MRTLKLIFWNGVILLFIFLLLEGATRLFARKINFQGTDAHLFTPNVYHDTPGLTPDTVGVSFESMIRTNSRGMRKYKCFEPRSKSKLLIGDSVTMGIGVDEDDTFMSKLTCAYGENHSILNVALLGYTSEDQKNVVNHFTALPDSIDQVVIFYCLNDIFDRNSVNLALASKKYIGEIFDFLRTNSRFYMWFKNLVTDRPKAYFLHEQELYKDAALVQTRIIEPYRTIKNTCDANGIELSVVVLPYEYQLRKDAEGEVFTPQKKVLQALNSLGITSYDSTPYFLDNVENSADAFLYADGVHLSVYGNQLVYEFVVGNGVLKK